MCLHTPCSSITVVLSAISHLVSRSLCLLVIGHKFDLGTVCLVERLAVCLHTPCSSITVVLSAISHLVSRSLCLLDIGSQV